MPTIEEVKDKQTGVTESKSVDSTEMFLTKKDKDDVSYYLASHPLWVMQNVLDLLLDDLACLLAFQSSFTSVLLMLVHRSRSVPSADNLCLVNVGRINEYLVNTLGPHYRARIKNFESSLPSFLQEDGFDGVIFRRDISFSDERDHYLFNDIKKRFYKLPELFRLLFLKECPYSLTALELACSIQKSMDKKTFPPSIDLLNHLVEKGVCTLEMKKAIYDPSRGINFLYFLRHSYFIFSLCLGHITLQELNNIILLPFLLSDLQKVFEQHIQNNSWIVNDLHTMHGKSQFRNVISYLGYCVPNAGKTFPHSFIRFHLNSLAKLAHNNPVNQEDIGKTNVLSYIFESFTHPEYSSARFTELLVHGDYDVSLTQIAPDLACIIRGCAANQEKVAAVMKHNELLRRELCLFSSYASIDILGRDTQSTSHFNYLHALTLIIESIIYQNKNAQHILGPQILEVINDLRKVENLIERVEKNGKVVTDSKKYLVLARMDSMLTELITHDTVDMFATITDLSQKIVSHILLWNNFLQMKRGQVITEYSNEYVKKLLVKLMALLSILNPSCKTDLLIDLFIQNKDIAKLSENNDPPLTPLIYFVKNILLNFLESEDEEVAILAARLLSSLLVRYPAESEHLVHLIRIRGGFGIVRAWLDLPEDHPATFDRISKDPVQFARFQRKHAAAFNLFQHDRERVTVSRQHLFFVPRAEEDTPIAADSAPSTEKTPTVI